MRLQNPILSAPPPPGTCTLIKKENQISSYIRTFRVEQRINEEMRKYFPICEEVVSHICLCNCSTLNFLMYEENFLFFFISVLYEGGGECCPPPSNMLKLKLTIVILLVITLGHVCAMQ
jgi:hypothetical protein